MQRFFIIERNKIHLVSDNPNKENKVFGNAITSSLVQLKIPRARLKMKSRTLYSNSVE